MNYSASGVFFSKIIRSKSINVKPHAALRNRFIWQWRVAKIGQSLIAAGDKQEMGQEDKHISNSCMKLNIKLEKTAVATNQNFSHEECVRWINVWFSFMLFQFSLLENKTHCWDAVLDTMAGSYSQHCHPLWNASPFSEVPSGNKYAHTSWHWEVKVGFCSTFVHYWKLPFLSSTRKADVMQTEVVSVQVSGASDLRFPLKVALI